MSELRVVRLNQIVCQEFNNILRTFYRDTLCDVTITEVKVSPDMHDAVVFVSILGDDDNEKNVLKILSKNLGQIKKRLFTKVQIKYSPRMVLKVDHSIRRGQEVLNILDSLEKND